MRLHDCSAPWRWVGGLLLMWIAAWGVGAAPSALGVAAVDVSAGATAGPGGSGQALPAYPLRTLPPGSSLPSDAQ